MKKEKKIKILIIIIISILIIIVGIIFINKNYFNENISQEELENFNTYFNLTENNGFLMSKYNNSDEIDINEVFYTGGNIKENLTDEEKKNFFDFLNVKEMHLPIIAISKQNAENFFYKKTGEKLNNIEEKLNKWYYNEGSNKFCRVKGDTNYKEIQCSKGKKIDEKTYKINYTINDNIEKKYGTVTLLVDNGFYLFKSNDVY